MGTRKAAPKRGGSKPQQQRGNGNTQTRQSTAIATRDQRVAQVRQMLTVNKGELTKALAKQLDTDQFLRLCMTHYQRGDERMFKADPRTFVAACVEAAQLGLKPDSILGECYLLPVWSSKANGYVVDFRLGYPGLIKLVRRGGDVGDFAAECVFANDDFEVFLGTDRRIHHVPWYSRGQTEPGPIIASYATAKLGDGSVSFEVVPKYMLDKRAAKSGDPRNSDPSNVWKEWEEAMSRKAAATSLCKWLPMEDRAKRAVRRDDQREAGVEDAINVAATERIVQVSVPPPENPQTLEDLTAVHRHSKGSGKDEDEDQRPPQEEDASQEPKEAAEDEDQTPTDGDEASGD